MAENLESKIISDLKDAVNKINATSESEIDKEKEIYSLCRKVINEANSITKELTVSKKHVAVYGELLRRLLEQSIYARNSSLPSYTRYAIYQQERLKISSVIKSNTKVVTKSQYLKALDFIEKELGYKVPDNYRVWL